MVTDKQVRRLKRMLGQGKSLQQSSEAAGIDVKTGRKYRDLNTLPGEMKKAHTWRTREDPFENVREEIKLLYEGSPEITSKQLLDILQKEYPGKYPDKLLRTLQRRVKELRKTTALVYDYQWLDDNDLNQKTDAAPQLKGVITHEAIRQGKIVDVDHLPNNYARVRIRI